MHDLAKYNKLFKAWQNRKQKSNIETRPLALKAIKLAEQCAAILHQDFCAQKVYPFGSLADGYFLRNSDIDLVVKGLDPRYYYKALCRIYQIAENFDVDFILFEDYKYKDEVLKSGILFDEKTKKWKNHPPGFSDSEGSR